MKRTIAWLLTAATALCLYGCGGKTSAPTAPSTTAPETVPETTAPTPVHRIAKETIIDGHYQCTGIYTYDEQGQLTRIERTHDDDGHSYNHEVFEYDQQGNLSLHETWFTDELLDSRYNYVYDAQTGRLIESYDKVVDDNIWCWYEYCYDANGRLEKRIVRDRLTTKNSVIGEQRYTYTQDGQVSRIEYYNAEEILLETTENTYENGLLIKKVVTTYNTDFNVVHTEDYAYDSEGYLIRCIRESCTDGISYAKAKITYIYEDVIIA